MENTIYANSTGCYTDTLIVNFNPSIWFLEEKFLSFIFFSLLQ